jgi:nucleotide-binding universal stress UspA family protein
MIPQVLSTEHRVKFKNIALLTDLGSGSESTLRYAALLARWYGAKLVVAHSYSPENYVYVPAGPLPMWPPSAPATSEDVDERARTLVASLGVQDVVSRVLTKESTVAGLLQELESCRPDLLVLATHGRTGIRKWLAGSVTEEVFRRVRWPVLVLSPQSCAKPTDEFSLRQVLFATDLSGVSGDALHYAAGIAQDHDAELLEVYVEPDKTQDYTFDRVLALQKLEDWLHEHMAAHGEMMGRAEHVVRFGEPAKEILETAATWKADLVVMGARGLGAMSALASHFIGGTAYEVACACSCPTLIVPPQQ